MFLTVCIPTFNRAYIIDRAIKSVINQSINDWELLVIDDGSTDNTKDIVSKYLSDDRIKYFYKDNGGKHTALNYGIQMALGEYFLILDSDNWLSMECVEIMKHILLKDNRSNICGVIGKCLDITSNKVIGEKFNENGVISYIDLHYKNKVNYGDCCECIKTSILKEYRWPNNNKTKFIPESFVLDKIGLRYNLLCTNEVLEFFEYLDDGITKNIYEFKKNNNIGFLINYVDKIDNIFNETKIPLKKKISTWILYWQSVSLDSHNDGPRVKRMGILGRVIKLVSHVFNNI